MKIFKCLQSFFLLISCLSLWGAEAQKTSIKGMLIDVPSKIKCTAYEVLDQKLKTCPKQVFRNIQQEEKFPTYQEFLLIHDQFPQDYYRSNKEKFLKRVRYEPKEKIDIAPIDQLSECDTPCCPYNREHFQCRDQVVRLISDHLTADQKKFSIEDDRLVITSFACGRLFTDLLIMLELSQQPWIKDYRIEINLIDEAYVNFLREGRLLEVYTGASIRQFASYLRHLFKDVKVYAYGSVGDYIHDIATEKRLRSHLIYGVDYLLPGEFDCFIDFSRLRFFGGSTKSLVFSMPYETEYANIYLQNALSDEEQLLFKKYFDGLSKACDITPEQRATKKDQDTARLKEIIDNATEILDSAPLTGAYKSCSVM